MEQKIREMMKFFNYTEEETFYRTTNGGVVNNQSKKISKKILNKVWKEAQKELLENYNNDLKELLEYNKPWGFKQVKFKHLHLKYVRLLNDLTIK